MATLEPVEPVDTEGQEPTPNVVADAIEVLFGLLAPAISAGQGVAPAVRRITDWGPLRAVAGATGRTFEGLQARGRTEQKRFLEALDEFSRRMLPQVLDAFFDRVDVNEIIGRVDLNKVMANVDFDALMERIDFGALTTRLLDEIDLRQIMRESTSSITSEAVDAVRVQGMNADRFVDRLVDRLLFRKTSRDLTGPVVPVALGELSGGPTTNGQDPVAAEGGEDGDAGGIGVTPSEDEG
jgi:hypothetical protein